MSKKITHEQARVDVAILNKTNSRLRLENEHEKRLNNYITQQEKVEKLLGLYREYFNTTETIFELNKYVKLSIPNDIHKNYHKKLEQIKEIENE